VDCIETNGIYFLEIFRHTRSLRKTSKREIEKRLIVEDVPSGSDLATFDEIDENKIDFASSTKLKIT